MLRGMKTVTLCAIFALASNAGAASWQPLSGPYEGPITAFASRAAVLYAGADDASGKAGGTALFRWPSGGSSWSAVASIPAGTQVRLLTQDGLGNLFAGTLNRGVYRSTDSGATWTQTNSGLTSLNVLGL